ncbi:hypothetical protein [Blastomonas sp. CCH13-E1]|uniref:hypothetical protein n=1 Tax=Blastomonas sp. CCH13-E1 TaxID=1768739 RepID=UPI00336A98C9
MSLPLGCKACFSARLRSAGARIHFWHSRAAPKAFEGTLAVGRVIGTRKPRIGQPPRSLLPAGDGVFEPVHAGLALIGGGLPGIALIGATDGILSERGGCSTYQRKEGEFMD